jgi:hypothetical protein
MKITDLDARFLSEYTEKGRRKQDSMFGAQGVMFQCPGCARGKEVEEEIEDDIPRRFVRGVHYTICWFTNPIGNEAVPTDATPGPGRWEAKGSNLSNLTLTPSVHTPECYHGYITNGEATCI